jgi:hypothetical protein
MADLTSARTPEAQAGRFFSMAARTSGSSGTVRGRNLAMTAPSGPSSPWTSRCAPALSARG